MATAKEKQRLRAEKAAAMIKEKERRERRRQILMTLGVVAAVVAVIGGGFLLNSLRDDSGDVSAAPVGSDYGLTVGEASAPHKVVVYEDFLCPICGEFEAAGHEQLEQLAEDGQVQIEYRPFTLLSQIGPYSALSAGVWGTVLENDGPDVAMAFHDALFADQPSEAGPFPDETDLVELAGESGADTDALQAALDEGAGSDWAEAATQQAADAGVNSTPTVLLDGRRFTDYRTPQDLAANLIEAVQ